MVKLIIEDDEGKTTVVPLIRDEITIGRKEGNTIRLTERNVSRRHARLVKQNGGAIFIEDLGSYNGIKVNGNKIAGRVAVAEGDRIQIGDYVLGLKLEGVAEAGATPAATPAGPPPAPAPHGSSEAKTVELPRPVDAPTAQIEVKDVAAPAPPPRPAAAAEAKPRTGETMGRLVCVSTNFPGQEWLLDKSLMVIGRTDDNDVVVNHRSISRHHARIVEEHGRYTIVDLQSSNGVRVNGEEYGKVELRRGDLIDLGHVRLRFVAAGEDFVFSRDASVVDISKPGGGHGALWIALTVVVLLVAGAVVWKFVLPSLSGGTEGGSGSSAGSGTGSAAGTGEGDQSQLVTDIGNAIGNEQWATAVSQCEKLSGEKKTTLKSECEKAVAEKAAKENFDKAFAAAVANRDLEAVRHWNKIPDGSTYKERDRKVIDGARDKALARLRTELDEAANDHACEKAKQVATGIKELDPADTDADAKAKGCSPTGVAVNVPPGGDNKTTKVKRPPHKVQPKRIEPKAPIVDPTVAKAQAAQLVQQAQNAYGAGQHALASKLAKQALRSDPTNLQAISVLGASSCYLKNESEARAAYNRLPSSSRNLLRQVCHSVGINL
jgi:ABC transport system ATP-binding/permease protein